MDKLVKTKTGLVFTIAQAPDPATDLTLAELRNLKERWGQEAEAAGHFDKLLAIGRELGRRVPTDHHGTFRIWIYEAAIPITPIVIVYREETGRLVRAGAWNGREATTTWETIETLSVYLGPEGWDISHRDSQGNPIFYWGTPVCQYTRSSHPRGDEPRFIVPGQWLNAALMFHQEARDHATQSVLNCQDTERQALIDQLLVGIEL